MLRALDVDRRTAENAATSRIFSFPFAALALEMLGMAAPMVRGVVTGQWDQYAVGEDRSREEILRRWDETTEQLESL